MYEEIEPGEWINEVQDYVPGVLDVTIGIGYHKEEGMVLFVCREEGPHSIHKMIVPITRQELATMLEKYDTISREMLGN